MHLSRDRPEPERERTIAAAIAALEDALEAGPIEPGAFADGVEVLDVDGPRWTLAVWGEDLSLEVVITAVLADEAWQVLDAVKPPDTRGFGKRTLLSLGVPIVPASKLASRGFVTVDDVARRGVLLRGEGAAELRRYADGVLHRVI